MLALKLRAVDNYLEGRSEKGCQGRKFIEAKRRPFTADTAEVTDALVPEGISLRETQMVDIESEERIGKTRQKENSAR